MTPLTSVRTLCLNRSFYRFLSTDVGDALTKEEYNEQFKEYQRKLHVFRVEAKEELEGRRRERERREKERRRSSAALEKERQIARETAFKERQFAHHQRQQDAKEAKVRQRQALSFKRETLRREMLSKAEDERYQKMLEESRTWITMETLTERIERALDHPTTLY